MADTVDTITMISGQNRIVVRMTNLSDSTGETGVIKINKSDFIGPDGVNEPGRLVIEELDWSVQGFESVILRWADASAQDAAMLFGDSYRDYRPWGGLVPAVSATTGDLLVSTGGTAISGDSYDIIAVVRFKL